LLTIRWGKDGVFRAVGRFVVAAVTLMMFLPMALFRSNQNATVLLSGIASGKTRVVDLSYAINDKLVPWRETSVGLKRR